MPEQADYFKISIDDFNRIFLLHLLKDSFLYEISQIEKDAGDKDVKLNLKIGNY